MMMIMMKKVAFDVSVAHYDNSALSSGHIFAQDGLKAAAEREKSKHRKFEAKLKRLRSACGRDLLCGREKARMLLKEVSELLEERKRKDYLESAYI